MTKLDNFHEVLDTKAHTSINRSGKIILSSGSYQFESGPKTLLIIGESEKEFPMDQDLDLTEEDKSEIEVRHVIEFEGVEDVLFLMREVGNALFCLGYVERCEEDKE
jgi:hypothetical protein